MKEVEQNVFAQKNDKTVRETLAGPRYTKLSQKILRNYSTSLDKPLGEFLLQLKNENNIFYKEFLNQHGDKKYGVFLIDNQTLLNEKGLYIYLIDDQIKYIGRCLDSFRKRINQGYGRFHRRIAIWMDNLRIAI